MPDSVSAEIPVEQSTETKFHTRRLRRIAAAALVFIFLSIYSYPAVRTAKATGSRRLPSMSAEDLGLYLSLSRLETDSHGGIVEPYYHIREAGSSLGFFKFRFASRLFGLLTNMFGGRMWPALFTWNLLCWGALCLSAFWLFDSFLPPVPFEFVLAAVAIFTLVDFNRVGPMLNAWRGLPSLSGFQSTQLAYIRPFMPQFPMVLLPLYLGLQIIALKKRSAIPWIAMGAVQLLAFMSYPYTTLILAGLSAVACAWYLVRSERQIGVRTVVAYVAGCALVDGIFVLQGQGGIRTSSPGQSSMLQFRPSLLQFMIGRLWIVMAILVLATILSRKLSPELKWPLAGLGLSTMFFVLGDVIVPERALFLSDHAGYFVHPTIVILSAFLFAAHVPNHTSPTFLRMGALAAIMFCVANGTLQAEGGYRAYLERNRVQADLATWLSSGQVSADDLVITTDHDTCSWVPLLSKAQVLFCRIAQCLLTPEQNLSVQRQREVLYLFFLGWDRNWLRTTNTGFESHGFYNEIQIKGEDPEKLRYKSRSALAPIFEKVETGDAAIYDFFRRFHRVWVVEDPSEQPFSREHLRTYLALGEEESAGALVITAASPK
jgi:hypothetical protein